MKNSIGRALAHFCLPLLLVVIGNVAFAQQTQRTTGTPVAASAQVSAADAQATADKAAAIIQATRGDKSMMITAVRSKNTDLATSVLLRSGYTAKQLQGAKIVLMDQTGPKADESKIKITIRATCCPLNITIIIQF